MSAFRPEDFPGIYASFRAPVAELDCGKRCAPYNERGVPFCCDTQHAVPTAYEAEWAYLKASTDLWHRWEAGNPVETIRLQETAPSGQVLIACQGHTHCQRDFRSVACRAFPFFPYLSREGDFLGLTYYWEYETRCWVISHLDEVPPTYRDAFVAFYDLLFDRMPEERQNFRNYSSLMRRAFSRRRRAIPLLHRNGNAYKVTPANGRMRRVRTDALPKFGPYRVAEILPFPEEGAIR